MCGSGVLWGVGVVGEWAWTRIMGKAAGGGPRIKRCAKCQKLFKRRYIDDRKITPEGTVWVLQDTCHFCRGTNTTPEKRLARIARVNAARKRKQDAEQAQKPKLEAHWWEE